MEKIVELVVLFLPVMIVVSYIYACDSKIQVETANKESENSAVAENNMNTDILNEDIDTLNVEMTKSTSSDEQINDILNKYI